jgi:transcriptional regulator with XRE-family HTH domain
MKVYKARDLAVKKLGAEEVARIEKEVRTEIAREAMAADLRAIRRMAGKTQSQAAAAIGVSQAQLSRTEAEGDHRVSTLRRYVEALGGELEVVARFGDRAVRLHGVGTTSEAIPVSALPPPRPGRRPPAFKKATARGRARNRVVVHKVR